MCWSGFEELYCIPRLSKIAGAGLGKKKSMLAFYLPDWLLDVASYVGYSY